MHKFNIKDVYLPLISGLLLIPGWYEWGTGLTLMVAFVPLLFLIEKFYKEKKSGRKLFLLVSLAFIIWNIGDTWWVRNALVDDKPSYAGISAAVLLTTLFMTIPVWLSFQTRKVFGRIPAMVGFVVFWVAMEFAYTNGEISWPWLTIGNGFIYEIKLIQWYEYTGVFGGSLWVLIANILVYVSFFNEHGEVRFRWKQGVAALLWIFIPVIISLSIFRNYKEDVNPVKIVVVQPNIDPYLKFNDIPSLEQTRIQVELAKSLADSATDYIVTPETSVMDNIWIGEFDEVPDFKLIKSINKIYPHLNYIAGIMCYQFYAPGDKLTPTAQDYRNGSHYDSYNSALQIDTTNTYQLYHKSKLVVGVEKMPYPGLLKILKPITLKLGGTFRSHNTQKERESFVSSDGKIRVGVPICYESVYGEFVTEFAKKGAELIFVITNDGWWGDTPGHRQHNALSGIRAIETRRSIARSANTGISCFINQKGEVLKSLGWWKRGAMVDTLNANEKITFYVRYGDYIGRAAFFTAIILFLSLFVKKLKDRYSNVIVKRQ